MVGSLQPPPGGILALRWNGEQLTLLDQTRLPDREHWVSMTGAGDTADAIRRLVVRGAPNIGLAGAYGLAMALAIDPSIETGRAAARNLIAARPTAVQLRTSVTRVLDAAVAAIGEIGPGAAAAAARYEAERLHRDEYVAATGAARHGADVLQGRRRILTHCNAGALATPGPGSALGAIAELAIREPGVEVLACETRPLLQGSRLTVWELERRSIPVALLPDAAAAGLIAAGEVDAVVVGCDRIAANGDVANKVGTYGHALAAAAAEIPMVVVGPWSTVDPDCPDGASIPIEERDADEVRLAGGTLITLPRVRVRNPAFDVTPAALITAIATEHGVADPASSILSLVPA